jgi:hypothetical protein
MMQRIIQAKEMLNPTSTKNPKAETVQQNKDE